MASATATPPLDGVPWTRALTVLRRHRLDQALADGAGPETGPELALRARQLTSAPHRRSVAEAVDRLIAEAHASRTGRSSAAPTSRRELLDAEPNMRELAARLTSEAPLEAQGVALAEKLLDDVT